MIIPNPSTFIELVGGFLIVVFTVAGFVALSRRKKTPSLIDAAEKASKENVKKIEAAKKQDSKNAKRLEEIRKKLISVKKETAPVPVASAPIPTKPDEKLEEANFSSLQEFPIGQKLGFEITRIVESTTKRIIIRKGLVAIKPDRFGRMPTLLFFAWGPKNDLKWVNASKIIKVTTKDRKGAEVVSYKLVYDLLLAEPLDKKGMVAWDEDLEMVLADSSLDQYVSIAATDLGFKFTPTLKRAMMVVGFLALLFGISVNGAAHVVPTTIIHWVP